MFVWLETTPVANWVALSLWAYPSLLSLHIVGLAVVVGIFLMRDLRLAGVIHGIDLSVFLRLGPLAWTGFAVNLISGLLLFSSQASLFATNTPFLIKIGCIAAGMMLAYFIQSGLRRKRDGEPGGRLKSMAVISLVIWFAAISAGRLVAYF